MKLEQQVCSLELAKRLKELGVKQESLCYWVEPNHSDFNIPFVQVQWPAGYTARPIIASAFAVAELGEMLPKWTSSWCDTEEYQEDGVKYGRAYICGREHEMRDRGEKFFVDITEADARAKMLAYLIENNLITLK